MKKIPLKNTVPKTELTKEEKENMNVKAFLIIWLAITLSFGLLSLLAGEVGITFLFAVLSFIYMLPTFISCKKDKKNLVAITILNILLGWTVLGWIGALIWSVLKEKDE